MAANFKKTLHSLAAQSGPLISHFMSQIHDRMPITGGYRFERARGRVPIQWSPNTLQLYA